MSPAGEVRRVAVGRISRPHGVKGEVSVLPLSDVESRFEPGSRLFAGGGDGGGDSGDDRQLIVRAARPHRQRMLVTFDGVPDRTAAEALAGMYLFVGADESPDLPEGEYWPHQLVGCEVVSESGRALGRMREIMRTQANDVWAVDGPEGEVLIPALKDVVVSVNVADRRIVVREIEGLTLPTAESRA